jgi:deazaflavin-dependent oxidoreductase (nitroreductase family)
MRLIDRAAWAGVRMGLARRSTALLETIGRRSGVPRVTPVTNGLDGDVFWIVTEHGHKANYVRNIEADPHVRVNVGGGWRTGVAQIVDEDPEERLQQIVALNRRARSNAQIVRRTGTEHLVIRIDLAGDH